MLNKSVSLSVRPSVSLYFARPFVRPSVSCLSVWPSVCLSVFSPVRLSACPSVCPSVRPSVRLSVLRPARPSISVCMSFYSLVCVFISKLLLGWVYSGSYSHTGPRSLWTWYIKRSDESFPRLDSSVSLMSHKASDLQTLDVRSS